MRGAGVARKASGFPVPGVHLPACFPQRLPLPGTYASSGNSFCPGGRLRQGHKTAGGTLSPGGWAASGDWSWGLAGPTGMALDRPALSSPLLPARAWVLVGRPALVTPPGGLLSGLSGM